MYKAGQRNCRIWAQSQKDSTRKKLDLDKRDVARLEWKTGSSTEIPVFSEVSWVRWGRQLGQWWWYQRHLEWRDGVDDGKDTGMTMFVARHWGWGDGNDGIKDTAVGSEGKDTGVTVMMAARALGMGVTLVMMARTLGMGVTVVMVAGKLGVGWW